MTFKSIEIQEAFDNAVAKRLKREEYSDYEAPKSKAKRFDAEMKRLGEGSSPRVRGSTLLHEQHGEISFPDSGRGAIYCEVEVRCR